MPKPAMNIVIIGVGSLGSLFAAYLAPHAPVTMLGHWPQQIEAISHSGLQLIQPDNTARPPIKIPITTAIHSLPAHSFDLALILVKGHQTERAATQAAQLLTPTGLAITLQNGLGNRDILAAVIGQDRAIQGITSHGANITTPGTVRHAGNGTLHIATTPSATTQLTAFTHLLTTAGLPAQLATNLDSLIWGKLAVNAGINPLTALLDVPNGFLAETTWARRWLWAAAEETATVAHAQQIPLPYPSAGQRTLDVAIATAPNISSMRHDMRRQAPTEIDAICGAIRHHGRLTHTPTPVNDQLYNWIKAQEAGTITPQTIMPIIQTTPPPTAT
ncbi:MAG TPA: 2-dehydropantoate 2-reductase [Anaerolineae bacterium]|nr:2-dehydropantoate 2-reductase [Anaerolineae bacterium]